MEIIVTSAAVAGFTRFQITLEEWNRYLAVNLTGTFLVPSAAMSDMVKAGWGRIVTISSAAGQKGAPRQGHYAASRGGVIALTKTIALDYAGIIDALATLRIDGEPPPDIELLGMLNLLIGGGFDTTTALTAHALEWLSQNAAERDRLSRDRASLLDPATEEFLRFFTPAPGDARTISQDMELDGIILEEGERLWLSWAMANRDPTLFDDPNRMHLDRKGNRHFSFRLGGHRCIGSNVARTVFKSMLTAVLDRMPDHRCDPGGAVHYDSIGVIQGMRHLPATFTPGPRKGSGLDETLQKLQRTCDEHGLARPITERKEAAVITA